METFSILLHLKPFKYKYSFGSTTASAELQLVNNW